MNIDKNREALIKAAENLGLGDVSSLSTEEIYQKYQESEHYKDLNKKSSLFDKISNIFVLLLGGTVMGGLFILPLLFFIVGFFGVDYFIGNILGISLHPLIPFAILLVLGYVMSKLNRFIDKTLMERHGEKFGLFGYGERIKQSFDMFLLKLILMFIGISVIGMGIYSIVKSLF